MKKAVYPLVCILLGLSLAACRSQVDYRECPDEAALGESFFLARNDLLQGTFYCGSDTAWHYFVVKTLSERGSGRLPQSNCHFSSKHSAKRKPFGSPLTAIKIG